MGKGVLGSLGVVMSINEQEGIATVKFPPCEYRRACKASDVLTVPISRLSTPRSEVIIHKDCNCYCNILLLCFQDKNPQINMGTGDWVVLIRANFSVISLGLMFIPQVVCC